MHNTQPPPTHPHDSNNCHACCCCLAYNLLPFIALRSKTLLKMQNAPHTSQEQSAKHSLHRQSQAIINMKKLLDSKIYQTANIQNQSVNIENHSESRNAQLSQGQAQSELDSSLIKHGQEQFSSSRQPRQQWTKTAVNVQQSDGPSGHLILKINNLGEQSENSSSPAQQSPISPQNKAVSINQPLFQQLPSVQSYKIQTDNIQSNKMTEHQLNQHNQDHLNDLPQPSHPIASQTEDPEEFTYKENQDNKLENHVLNNILQKERTEHSLPAPTNQPPIDKPWEELSEGELPNEERIGVKQEEDNKRVKEELIEHNKPQENRSSIKSENTEQIIAENIIKQEIIEQLRMQQITPPPSPLSQSQDYQPGEIDQHEEPYYPYSQPEQSHQYFQTTAIHTIPNIHSQDQGFMYAHEQLEAEKSRYSRRSKKLDQQLQHQQRKQFTELESAWAQKQKMQYNSQSNKHSIKMSKQSEPLSLPFFDVKGQQLKKQQGVEEQKQKEEREINSESSSFQHNSQTEQRMKEQSQLDEAMDKAYASASEEEDDISQQIKFDYKYEAASPIISNSSDSENSPLGKKEENQSSYYALISLEEELKKEPQQMPSKQEEPDQNYFQESIKEQQKQQQLSEQYESSVEDSDDANELNPKSQHFSYNKIQDSIVYQQQIVPEMLLQQNQPEQQRDSERQEQPSESYSNRRLSDDYYASSEEEENFKEEASDNEIIKSGNLVPKISKKAALEMKRQSKQERKQRIFVKQENLFYEKQNKCQITKMIEITIRQPTAASFVEPKQEEDSPQPHFHKISISNQFSFTEGTSRQPTYKTTQDNDEIIQTKQKRQPYLNYTHEDYSPNFYQQRHKVVTKCPKKKLKHRVIEQIMEDPQREYYKKIGSTKKMARQYTLKHIQLSGRHISQDRNFQQVYLESTPHYKREQRNISQYYLQRKAKSPKRSLKPQFYYQGQRSSRVLDDSSAELLPQASSSKNKCELFRRRKQ